MMGSTRGTPEGFRHGQASGSQQPPPPPPNLVEVMTLQTELLQQLVQGQQNQPHGREDHILQAAGYQEFFGTHPRCFTRPMNLGHRCMASDHRVKVRFITSTML